MTNNSGKFISTISTKEADASVGEISTQIPPAPKAGILQYVEECFGRYWWVWIILLLIIKRK